MVGCTPYKNTISLVPTNSSVVGTDLTYAWSADQIRLPENKIRTGWANRKNVQVLQVQVTNNTNKTLHGSQLGFFSHGIPLELADNMVASKKLRTRKFPKIVYAIPITLVALTTYVALLSLLEDDSEDHFFQDDYNRVKKSKKDPLAGKNTLQKGLYQFNITTELIQPGQTISGLVGFKSKENIDDLTILIKETNYEAM
ncbi:MAG: hypothetical protein CSA36_05955 [Draconibacterium sp.]|nr:MAG: hypothetical protein CSA36_05955 [Draconibacterium sp.]